MATYYAGPINPVDSVEVTVRTPASVSREQWVNSMLKWAEEHDLIIRWQGESTHTKDDEQWHQAHFIIAGAENRTLFMLRWA